MICLRSLSSLVLICSTGLSFGFHSLQRGFRFQLPQGTERCGVDARNLPPPATDRFKSWDEVLTEQKMSWLKPDMGKPTPDTALIGAIDSSQKIEAIQSLGEARIVKAVPKLIELLKADHKNYPSAEASNAEVEAILNALVRIGGEDALKGLKWASDNRETLIAKEADKEVADRIRKDVQNKYHAVVMLNEGNDEQKKNWANYIKLFDVHNKVPSIGEMANLMTYESQTVKDSPGNEVALNWQTNVRVLAVEQLVSNAKSTEYVPLLIKAFRHESQPLRTRFKIAQLLLASGETTAVDFLKEQARTTHDTNLKKVIEINLFGNKIVQYEFGGRRFFSADEAQDFLVKKYCAQNPKVPPPQTVPLDFSGRDPKAPCPQGYFFNGKCYLDHHALINDLIQKLYPTDRREPGKTIEEGPSKEVGIQIISPDDFKTLRSPKSSQLGEYFGPREAYLRLKTFTSFTDRGPTLRGNAEPSGDFIANRTAPYRVCWDKKLLQKLMPGIDLTSVSGLPVGESSQVVLGSIKDNGKTFCYELQDGKYILSKDAVSAAIRKSKNDFRGFVGIEALPEDLHKELKELWAGGKTLTEKVTAIETFWRTKVEYQLDPRSEYQRYFDEHPMHNLLQAACSLKKGNCVPKNFALGVAIYQLSHGLVAVRFNSSFWLDGIQKKERELVTSDKLHLHTEYLEVADNGTGQWKTAEAAISYGSVDEKEKARDRELRMQNFAKKELVRMLKDKKQEVTFTEGTKEIKSRYLDYGIEKDPPVVLDNITNLFPIASTLGNTVYDVVTDWEVLGNGKYAFTIRWVNGRPYGGGKDERVREERWILDENTKFPVQEIIRTLDKERTILKLKP